MEKVRADAVGVERFEQLALLSAEGLQLVGYRAKVCRANRCQLIELAEQVVSQGVALGLAQGDGAVVVFDAGLEVFEAVVWLLALTALLADTDEVLVDRAELASVAAVEQSRAAVAAEERAGEVVVVPPCPLAVVTAIGQYLLDLFEDLLRHERRVTSLVWFAVERDDPDVVRIPQDARKPVWLQRLRGRLARRLRSQPARFEHGSELFEGVVAAGIQVKCLGDERRAVWVGRDVADLPAVVDLGDVDVADRSAMGCAADLDLARETATDILADLQSPARSHGCHHAFEDDLAAAVAADPLFDRDQASVRAADQTACDPVVFLVSRPAVDAPHDHVVDISALFDESEHRLECLALADRLRRHARFDELLNDFGPERCRLLGAGLPLGGKGQALLVVVLIDLLRA